MMFEDYDCKTYLQHRHHFHYTRKALIPIAATSTQRGEFGRKNWKTSQHPTEKTDQKNKLADAAQAVLICSPSHELWLRSKDNNRSGVKSCLSLEVYTAGQRESKVLCPELMRIAKRVKNIGPNEITANFHKTVLPYQEELWSLFADYVPGRSWTVRWFKPFDSTLVLCPRHNAWSATQKERFNLPENLESERFSYGYRQKSKEKK